MIRHLTQYPVAIWQWLTQPASDVATPQGPYHVQAFQTFDCGARAVQSMDRVASVQSGFAGASSVQVLDRVSAVQTPSFGAVAVQAVIS